MTPNDDLLTRVKAVLGPSVTQPAVFKLLPVLKKPGDVSRLLGSYLDERSKTTITRPDQLTLDPRSPEYADEIMRKKAPLRPNIDYIDSGLSLQYFGTLKQVLNDSVGPPESLTPEQQTEVVLKWWLKKTRNRSKKGYHLIFSLDPRVALELTKRGLPIDPILISMIAKSLSEYNARFYPEATIGYVAGVHHDKLVPHVHVLLFPQLSNGRSLSLSNNSRSKIHDEVVAVHYHSILQGSLYNQAKEIYEELKKCHKFPLQISQSSMELLLVAISRQAVVGRIPPGQIANGMQVEEERQKLLNSPDLVAILERYQQNARQRKASYAYENFSPFAKPVGFRDLSKAASEQAAATRALRLKLGDDFRACESERNYRPVFYATGHPHSPSSTKSFLLGKHVRSLGDIAKLPQLTELDASATRQLAVSRVGPSSTNIQNLNNTISRFEKYLETVRENANSRFIQATYLCISADSNVALKLGKTPKHLSEIAIAPSFVNSDDLIRKNFEDRVKTLKENEAWDHRLYDPKEYEGKSRAPWLKKSPIQKEPEPFPFVADQIKSKTTGLNGPLKNLPSNGPAIVPEIKTVKNKEPISPPKLAPIFKAPNIPKPDLDLDL